MTIGQLAPLAGLVQRRRKIFAAAPLPTAVASSAALAAILETIQRRRRHCGFGRARGGVARENPSRTDIIEPTLAEERTRFSI
ncbi:MAG TPA: hypothetical protein VGM07_16845 [Stellaceae bacterium]